MKKLEEIQNTKIMSNYGGCGSVIETRTNGSLLIKDYGAWGCFANNQIGNRRQITNPRVIQEIKNNNGYSNIETLYEIPTLQNDEINVYRPTINDLTKTVNSIYFPRWFYCKRTRILRKLDEWEAQWNEKFHGDNRFRKNFPSCDCCSERQRHGNRISRRRLEQFRFVMISMDNGEIADIPFEYILNPNNQIGKTDTAWFFDGNMKPCDNELKYRVSTQSNSLASERVYNGDRYIDMATLNNKYLVFPEDMFGIKKGAYKLALRNASNIYFPNILKAIYLPLPSTDDKMGIIDQYDGMIAENLTQEQAIGIILKGKRPLSEFQIRDIIEEHNDPGRAVDLNNLTISEFNYITNEYLYRNNSNERSERDFTAVRFPNIQTNEIKNIYALTQLKETTVLLSYTRASNKECRWWNVDNEEEVLMTPKQKYPIPQNSTYIPAIEAYGEGLLFVLNSVEGFDAVRMETYAHTFSHLLMKELEFMCGYPVTSLKERLYFDTNNGRYGFLIYTIAGSEGSYGGLTSLMPSDTNSTGKDSKILKLIERAKMRAEDCPNDPICINEEKHCFACVDLPETSCTEWNKDLDRAVFLKALSILNTDENNNQQEQNEENPQIELEEGAQNLQDERNNQQEQNEEDTQNESEENIQTRQDENNVPSGTRPGIDLN